LHFSPAIILSAAEMVLLLPYKRVIVSSLHHVMSLQSSASKSTQAFPGIFRTLKCASCDCHRVRSTLLPFARTMSTTSFREEKDTMGIVKVPADRLYGAQTQRSVNNFKIGAGTDWNVEQMPKAIVQSLAILKKACCRVNSAKGDMDGKIAKAIEQACDDILNEKVNVKDEFPLVIWQTGSGTQTNMNCNEVIAN